MDKVGRKLQEGQNVIEQVGTRTRAIQKKLRDVQALPEAHARPPLEPSSPSTRSTSRRADPCCSGRRRSTG